MTIQVSSKFLSNLLPPPTAQINGHKDSIFGMWFNGGNAFGASEAIFYECPLRRDLGV